MDWNELEDGVKRAVKTLGKAGVHSRVIRAVEEALRRAKQLHDMQQTLADVCLENARLLNLLKRR